MKENICASPYEAHMLSPAKEYFTKHVLEKAIQAICLSGLGQSRE